MINIPGISTEERLLYLIPPEIGQFCVFGQKEWGLRREVKRWVEENLSGSTAVAQIMANYWALRFETPSDRLLFMINYGVGETDN